MTIRRFVLGLALALAFGPLGGIPTGAEEPWRPEEPELVEILKAEGYGRIERLPKGGITFKANGMPFALFRYDDGDLLLYYGIRGVKLPVRRINDWNRTQRLTRAFIDREGDPVLEADLLANSGLQEEAVTEFVRVFVQIARRYRGYVLAEGDVAKPAPPPAALQSEL